MAITNFKVESTQTSVLFTASGSQAITTMFFCNTSASTDTSVTVYLVPNGISVSDGNMVIKSLSLPKTETFVFDAEKLILDNGDSVQAIATTDKIVVATISSVSIS